MQTVRVHHAMRVMFTETCWSQVLLKSKIYTGRPLQAHFSFTLNVWQDVEGELGDFCTLKG